MNNNVNLIRKMINLVETTEKKIIIENNESEMDVDEQVTQLVKPGLETLAKVLETEKGLFSTLKNEIPSLSKFRNADELIAGLKSGSVPTEDAFKIIKQSMRVPEIALKVKGLIGESPTFKEILKKVFPKGGSMPPNPENFKMASQTIQKTYGLSVQEAEALLKKGGNEMMSAGGIATKDVDAALSRRGKDIKGSSPEVKPFVDEAAAIKPTENINGLKSVVKEEAAAVSAVEKAGRNIGFYGAKTWDKLKALKSRMSVKQLLLYGLATYGAYKLIKGLFTSDPKTNGVLPSCIANLPDVQFVIGSGDVVVAVLKDGVDTTSNGHGGVQFWPNGRVLTVDGQVRGRYYCKGTSGGKETVSASLNEQQSPMPIDSTFVAKSQPITPIGGKYDNIHIDWDGASTGTKPTPKTGGGGSINYRNCNDFPFTFGCINPKIGEIQQCLGVTPTKGYFGPKTRNVIKGKGYDLSGGITQEMYDTLTSTCKGNTPMFNDKFQQPSAIPKADNFLSNQIKNAEKVANSSIKPATVTPTKPKTGYSPDEIPDPQD